MRYTQNRASVAPPRGERGLKSCVGDDEHCTGGVDSHGLLHYHNKSAMVDYRSYFCCGMQKNVDYKSTIKYIVCTISQGGIVW